MEWLGPIMVVTANHCEGHEAKPAYGKVLIAL